MSDRPRILITISADEGARSTQRYVAAVEQAGAEPILLHPADIAKAAGLLEHADGLFLCGGVDVEPQRYGQAVDPEAGVVSEPALDALEFGLLETALARDLPVLGICRGFQVLNVGLGGQLIQDLPNHRAVEGKSVLHPIQVRPHSKLAAILGATGQVATNSRHHQGVSPETLAPHAAITATTLDGDLVEGLESSAHRWVVGVQCHPERVDEVPPVWQNLFRAFVQAATPETVGVRFAGPGGAVPRCPDPGVSTHLVRRPRKMVESSQQTVRQAGNSAAQTESQCRRSRGSLWKSGRSD